MGRRWIAWAGVGLPTVAAVLVAAWAGGGGAPTMVSAGDPPTVADPRGGTTVLASAAPAGAPAVVLSSAMPGAAKPKRRPGANWDPIDPDDLPLRVQAAIAGARDYLFTLQSDKVLLLVGENSEVVLDGKHAKLERIEVAATWKEVVVTPATRTVRIKGKEYKNVYLVMPPGWFGPSEWVKGEPHDSTNAGGHTALITAALLAAHTDPTKDPRMKAAVDCLANMWMRELGHIAGKGTVGAAANEKVIGLEFKGKVGGPAVLDGGPMGTHAIGLRAQAMAQALRYFQSDGARAPIIKALQRDARMLVAGHHPTGGYGHVMLDPKDTRPGSWGFRDWGMARSQYGILGLWAASAAPKVELPDAIWLHLNKFLLEEQNTDGGWAGSSKGVTTGSLTAAGIASLLLIMDQYHCRTRAAKGPDITPFELNPLLLRSLLAVDKALASYAKTIRYDGEGYNMYSLERVGVAAGLKYINGREWYREGAEAILQNNKGLGGAIISKDGDFVRGATVERETAWSLLFLVHGGAPVFINKLRWGPPSEWRWNNYPRDAGNMARWHEQAFEQEAGWQVVSLTAPAADDDLLDAPILYVTGWQSLDFGAAEAAKLRRYVDRGGTLLFATCGIPGAGAAFGKSVQDVLALMYPPAEHPEVALARLPDTHPVRTDGSTRDPAGKITPVGRLGALDVSHAHNGRRSFLFLVNEDIAWSWHANSIFSNGEKLTSLQFLANLKRYCLDRGPLPPKLRTSLAAGIPQPPDRGPFRLGTVKFTSKGKIGDAAASGDWRTIGSAWEQFTPWFRRAAGFELKVEPAIDLAMSDLKGIDALHIAGNYDFELSAPELAGLTKYINEGGVVLIDQPGGRDMAGEKGFLTAATKQLKAAFGDKFARAGPGHAVLTGKFPHVLQGFPVGAEGSTTRTLRLRGIATPNVQVVTIDGRPAIVLSEVGVSCGLSGENFLDREGLLPRAARELAANVLMSGRAFKAPAPAADPKAKANP